MLLDDLLKQKKIKKRKIYDIFKKTNLIKLAFRQSICDKAVNITKSPKYYGYQRGLTVMVYGFFLAVVLPRIN